MHVIFLSWTLPNPLQLHAAFGPAWSPERAGTFQTWTLRGVCSTGGNLAIVILGIDALSERLGLRNLVARD